ncbi:MAG: acylphosphatase [Candidatus Omnitrophica bacterium]|nr:acylphosphatase [Candidatus Omnitrophota bacterium]
MKTIQYHVIFTGLVQGVGFRYTARDMARDFGLAGWVRNLADGSVEMVVEGKEDLLEEFLRQLEGSFSIRDKKISRTETSGHFVEFEIRF